MKSMIEYLSIIAQVITEMCILKEVIITCNRRKLKDANRLKHNNFQNKGMKFLLIHLKEPLKTACSSLYR